MIADLDIAIQMQELAQQASISFLACGDANCWPMRAEAHAVLKKAVSQWSQEGMSTCCPQVAADLGTMRLKFPRILKEACDDFVGMALT